MSLTPDRPTLTPLSRSDCRPGRLLLAGTRKGLFSFRSSRENPDWQVEGPLLSGWEVSALCIHGHRILIGACHLAYGATIRVSDDGGDTWRQLLHGPRFQPESGRTLQRIWRIVPGTEPGSSYAGVDDAALFISRDGGERWTEVRELSEHPSRSAWSITGGGICLHSILPDPRDPDSLVVAISDGGVLATNDGGRTWQPHHRGLPGSEDSAAGDPPGYGIVRLVRDPGHPHSLYARHRTGIYASTNGGETWHPIHDGLPVSWGFSLAVSQAGDLFTAPLDPETRCFPDGRVRVYRRAAGSHRWEPLEAGLPTEPHFVGVLRDGLVVDQEEPAGVYLGTTQGDLFCSSDLGDRWRRIPGQFSRIGALFAH